METKKDDKIEENKKEDKIEDKKENLLESGRYAFLGPENGDISIENLEFLSDSGKRRIWKVESMDAQRIVFKVIKF
ncbi:MAG: hypothetical protein AABX11_03975 [Nanoarchaeota archaeon]